VVHMMFQCGQFMDNLTKEKEASDARGK